MDKQELMNKIKEQCGDCEAWSGTDCTRNPYTQGCLKDEKKPTIEEIVKSIENCKKNGIENTCQYCYTCPASIWDFEEGITECNVDLFQKTIDLIHRLQSENAEQKTEIERLKATGLLKENEQLKKDLQRKELLRQKAVLYAEEKHAKNSELQKQVDELTAKHDCPTDITEAVKPFVKQAVKDTAKEIYHLIDMFPIPTKQGQQRYATGFENGLTAIKLKIAERFGVEVER